MYGSIGTRSNCLPELHHSQFSSRFVGVVDGWKDFRNGDETVSFPGATEPGRTPCAPRWAGPSEGPHRPMKLGLGKHWIESHLHAMLFCIAVRTYFSLHVITFRHTRRQMESC